ncbi:uncharacterized protein LOC135468429 [Liolophura sinensis]|uniref:uncharacterized protein LOC135468429 n=1 Tax=Liolophura sinensis TaxID=3198878 RepID=UPI003158CC7C
MAGLKRIFTWPVGIWQGLPLRNLLFMYIVGVSVCSSVESIPLHKAQQRNDAVLTDRNDSMPLYLGDNGISQPVCNLTANPSDAKEFLRRLLSKQANFAYFRLAFPQNISLKVRDDVFLPFIWVWTTTTRYGAMPYLQFDYDAGKLSFGLLDFYTLRDVYIRFDAEPENCSLELGGRHATYAVGTALGNMTLKYLHGIHEKNYSVFCQIVKLDPNADNKWLFDFSTYFGYWKDPTGYSCCSFYRDKKLSQLKLTCGRRTIKVSDWSSFFYFIAVICFMYLCIPLSLLFDYGFGGTIVSLDSPEVLASSETTATVDDETPLLRGTRSVWGHLSQTDPSDDDWFYLGLDKPITLISMIGTPFKCIGKRFPLLISRMARFFLFAVIIPLPVYVKVMYYRLIFRFSITERMKVGIPVGFLSMPYGISGSAANWLTIFGGPIVVFGVYLTIGQICICAPKNISTCFISVFERENGCKNTLLSMDLSTIELFGSVKMDNKSVHSTLRHLLQGNVFTLLNPSFWKFAFRFCNDRFRRWFCSEIHFCAVTYISVFFYIMLCIAEITLCIVYYGFPTVFCCINFTRAYLKHFASRGKRRVLMYPLIIFSLLFTYYSFFLIFVRGMLFILLVIDYTYIGVIIYPTLALGFVIATGTMLLYLGSSSQKFSDSYLIILHEIVKINLTLKNTSEESDVASIRDEVLILKHLNARTVKELEIGGISIPLTQQQRQILKLTQPAYGSKAASSGITSKLIRWRGPYPGIPRELFFYVVEKHRPLRRAIFVFLVELTAFTVVVTSIVKLIIAFNRLSSFTLPAQVVTAIVLTILPKLNAFFTTQMERNIEKEITINKIKITVDNFYSQRENAWQEQSRRYLIPVV